MTALEIKAIKLLPEEWVKDDTFVCTSNEYVMAANAALGMIIFKDGSWSEMKSK